MRFTITKVSGVGQMDWLQRVVYVEDWFLEEKRIKRFKEARVIRVTPRAVMFGTNDGNTVWIPRSVMQTRKRMEKGLEQFAQDGSGEEI